MTGNMLCTPLGRRKGRWIILLDHIIPDVLFCSGILYEILLFGFLCNSRSAHVHKKHFLTCKRQYDKSYLMYPSTDWSEITIWSILYFWLGCYQDQLKTGECHWKMLGAFLQTPYVNPTVFIDWSFQACKKLHSKLHLGHDWNIFNKYEREVGYS